MSKTFEDWTTTKRIVAEGYQVVEGWKGRFEIWKNYQLVATVMGGNGLWAWWNENINKIENTARKLAGGKK